jgi:hypothetical protein
MKIKHLYFHHLADASVVTVYSGCFPRNSQRQYVFSYRQRCRTNGPAEYSRGICNKLPSSSMYPLSD